MKIYNYCTISKGNTYLNYQTKSYKYKSISTETQEYFKGNPFPVTTFLNKYYSADKVSLPSSIVTSTSISGVTKSVNLYYPGDITTIGNLSETDITNLNILQNNKHNVSEVIKTENLLNGNLLDSKQVSFSNFQGNILPSLIKSKKATNIFEDRVEFLEYNFYGNPTLVSLKNGIKVRYYYNTNQQVTMKIENADGIIAIDDSINFNTTPCHYQNQYPNSMVIQYHYDPITNNLISIVDPKCDKTTYIYDSFGRLQFVKDKDNNILSENEYHYKN